MKRGLILVFIAAACWAGAQSDPEIEGLKRLEARVEMAEAQAAKAPGSKGLALVARQLRMVLGYRVMNAGSLAPREKYPQALRHFGMVLKASPNHKEAAAHKKLIEDIYKSMGRPVPQVD
jgi:hypothetical protein